MSSWCWRTTSSDPSLRGHCSSHVGVDRAATTRSLPLGASAAPSLARRECLDHVIVFNENCLRRYLQSFTDNYHRSRTHLSLEKDTPEPRQIQQRAPGRSWPFLKSAACLIDTNAAPSEQVFHSALETFVRLALQPIAGVCQQPNTFGCALYCT